ncbi:hypothetical protein LAZ67_14001162 [Cordylochernes scorpioides]|uniref:Transposase n=1 Tax=Cordylochernes scorpioides TaxID=51811 RepID=A0ABY6L5X6_9ARAC|nr:hypothetical protein LAZ67_14001162 [Cordylochernes scorpioides]
MERSLEQRYAIKFCVRLGKNATETFQMLQKAFKDDCISRSQSGKWHKAFKEGREEVADEPRSGRPTTARTDEDVDRVLEILRTDRRLSIQQIADTLHMSTFVVHGIVTEDLQMRKSCAWHTKSSPRPKKARMSKSRIKTMIIVFFDIRGIVHYTVKLHHDNATSHTAFIITNFLARSNTPLIADPPYSPDLAPCDFFLFPRLKREMKGKHWETVENIQHHVTTFRRSIPVEEFQGAFQAWQTRLLHVVQAMIIMDGSGRPRATTEREDRAIVRMAVAAPESTLSTIQRVTGTQVSKMTINRRLRVRNLSARRPLRCLPLTPVHRQVRLQWCRERSTWNCADWGRIVFSDESRFLLCPDDGRKRVWRRPGQRVDPGLTVEHHTGPQQGVMVWGAISFDSRTPLVVIPGTLTAQRYIDDILRSVLLPILSHHPGLTFQQYNSRPHTARVTMDCLQSCRTLPWPAKSPDLSPIEHIWDVMGRRLQPSRNVDYLARQLETIWQEIPQHTIRNLYQSMTRLVAACIQASGGPTTY